MLTKIKRQECFSRYTNLPWRTYNEETEEEEFFYPKVYRSYVLILPSRSFRGHATALGKELSRLTKELNIPELIFLGDNDLPWLNQDNDYKPAQQAKQYLKDHKVGRRFNGALQVSTSELPVFTRHLTWLTRCNASLPYFHFVDPDQNYVGNICRYGALHFDTMNRHADKLLSAYLVSSNFLLGDQNSCYNQFGKTSAIAGRQITV